MTQPRGGLRLIHTAHVLEVRRSLDSPPPYYRPCLRPEPPVPDYSFFKGVAVACFAMALILGLLYVAGLMR